jgi:hypothetical protein
MWPPLGPRMVATTLQVSAQRSRSAVPLPSVATSSVALPDGSIAQIWPL